MRDRLRPQCTDLVSATPGPATTPAADLPAPPDCPALVAPRRLNHERRARSGLYVSRPGDLTAWKFG